MKIEIIKHFPDGNWVAYGPLIGNTLKSVELARGKGQCPYEQGQEIGKSSMSGENNGEELLKTRMAALANATAMVGHQQTWTKDGVKEMLAIAAMLEEWITR